MSKKGFRFDAKRISTLKASLSTIKNDTIKSVAKEVTDRNIGGLADASYAKIIVGHTKHV